MTVTDAMVIIHLAKMTLLETSWKYFKPMVIPEAVHQEILAGKKKGYEDVAIVEELLKVGTLRVRRVKDTKLLKRAEAFNVQRGEAEAVALYWQEHADYLASDDDNLRKKGALLNIRLIGTPAIILTLYRNKLISKDKLIGSVQVLRNIGWFSNAVIDTIIMEAR